LLYVRIFSFLKMPKNDSFLLFFDEIKNLCYLILLKFYLTIELVLGDFLNMDGPFLSVDLSDFTLVAFELAFKITNMKVRMSCHKKVQFYPLNIFVKSDSKHCPFFIKLFFWIYHDYYVCFRHSFNIQVYISSTSNDEYFVVFSDRERSNGVLGSEFLGEVSWHESLSDVRRRGEVCLSLFSSGWSDF